MLSLLEIRDERHGNGLRPHILNELPLRVSVCVRVKLMHESFIKKVQRI